MARPLPFWFTAAALVAGFVLAGPFQPETSAGRALESSKDLTPKQRVGKMLFLDTSLSDPPGQSCASCHDPANHFAHPKHPMIAEGATKGRFGNRRPPSIAYASFSPSFHYDTSKKDYIGGYFWDGRAKSLKEQAKGPLLNPAEMNNSSRQQVVDKVAAGRAAGDFQRVFGAHIFEDRDRAFDSIAESIADYERSAEFHPFSSRYDAYLHGEVKLTREELHGLKVFESEKLGNCAACHPSKPGPHGEPPLFTDFSYDNIGLAQNAKNPFLRQPKELNPEGRAYLDEGLARTTARTRDAGRFKVPTLRNVAVTGPYFHHSGIASLNEAILFYSLRDTGRFGKAELPKTMNRKELGSLYLTKTQVRDLEAFLRTLTDGYKAEQHSTVAATTVRSRSEHSGSLSKY